MELKRPLTITACILNIICTGLIITSTIIELITITSITDTTLESYTDTIIGMAVAYGISLIMGIIIFFISIILLAKSKLDVFEFPQGLSLTLFVFDIIYTVLYFISLFVVMSSLVPIGIIMCVIIFIVYLLSTIFLRVDISRNNKQKIISQQEEKIVVSNKDDTKQLSKSNDLLDELVKLQKMKETGMITDSEFNKLKSKLLDKY